MEKIEIPDNWTTTKLKVVVNYKKGKKPKILKDEEFENSVPYLDVKAFEKNDIRRYADIATSNLITENDVGVLWDGARSGWSTKGKNGAVGSTIAILKPIKINSSFLYNFLQSKYDFLNSNTRGTGIPHVDPKILWDLDFPIPPLPEQDRIVAKVDVLMAQVETMQKSLERIPQLLKDFRQQVLTQAVTGKLTEEWRLDTLPKKVESEKFKEFRNKEFIEQNQTLINEGRRKQKFVEFNSYGNDKNGWIKTDIESASLFIVDCLHNTPNFIQTGDNYVIDTTSISPFKINWKKARRVNDEQFKEWISRMEPSVGDIIFSREGSIGVAVKVPEKKKISIGQRTMIFRFSSLCMPRFMEFLMNSNSFKNKYRPFIKGVAAQHLNIRDIRKIEISIPSLKEQNGIVAIANSLLDKIDTIEKKYKTLKSKIDTLPQAILHKAFKGELVEQLASDGDARELLKEIEMLKKVI